MSANTIEISTYKSPVGDLLLGSFENKLCLCDWKFRKMRAQIDQRIQQGLKAQYIEKESEVCQKTTQQLDEYFEGKRNSFDIPMLFVGTDFQQQVWQELIKIPYGKTMAYLQLSRNLNNEKAIRAVASANGANAISILVPCHRIIGSSGELIGYAGGLNTKKRLLSLENPSRDNQLNLFE